MQIRVGYELIYECPQPIPMILNLNIHYTRASDIVIPDFMTTDPRVPVTAYRDVFGNWCSRIVAPKGRIRIASTGVVRDTSEPDEVASFAYQQLVQDLREETLVFLLGSRYCETDHLSQVDWDLFDRFPPGWARVQAICDFVHNHVAFDYQQACPSKTAEQVFKERRGVCRDYAHLALTFCRCMNIPARYCAGYLGDIGDTLAPRA
jgi:transglutaminase-like putative cysteine protease